MRKHGRRIALGLLALVPAILGIVACKVSAENGPIRPGDRSLAGQLGR